MIQSFYKLRNAMLPKLLNVMFVGFSIILISANNFIQVENTSMEQRMYNLIMDYRANKNLPVISYSIELEKVAKAHATDLMLYYKTSEKCNLHSWSKNGKWQSCCYTADHKQSNCMWQKPAELSNYKATGYEIACYTSDGETPEQALKQFIESKYHKEVIVNTGIWKNTKWQAIGIGFSGNYATVWFGEAKDAL
jgi:uncharacterized protein YkwD